MGSVLIKGQTGKHKIESCISKHLGQPGEDRTCVSHFDSVSHFSEPLCPPDEVDYQLFDFYEETKVKFADLSETMLWEYIDSGEPM